MPFKDPEVRREWDRNRYHNGRGDMCRYRQRTRYRDKKHPGWRQTFVDAGGSCTYRLANGELCGERDKLEFHEPFGEDHKGDGRMQLRQLVCRFHHRRIHATTVYKNGRLKDPATYQNFLQDDIAYEIAQAGSYEAWLKQYNLVDLKVKESVLV